MSMKYIMKFIREAGFKKRQKEKKKKKTHHYNNFIIRP